MKPELAVQTNAYLANLGVAYVKLHNLHWNVVGLEFKAVHEYIETLYDAIALSLDEVAEILRMSDELPLGSMKAYLEVATIKELGDKEITVRNALKTVLADLELLNEQALELGDAADDEDHLMLESAMDAHTAQYAKDIWFVRSMLKK